MNSPELLKEIETHLRNPDNDKRALLMQLKACIDVAILDEDKEDGLTRGALGGIHYCINRLREHWAFNGKSKSLEELETIYADVEVLRFTNDPQVVMRSEEHYQSQNILFRRHRIELPSGSWFALSAARNQTTIDGVLIAEGEMLSMLTAPVAPFHEIVDRVVNRGGK